LSWGIPLPFDKDYVTYVWFDALINYISAVGYGSERFGAYWPADFHVIGKDILVPSHSVYWPAMLKAAGVEPPKALLVHGWWHIGGQKMSKSAGVKIDPGEFAATYGADALRYFLTREMSVGQDSDFTQELFLNRYHADLSNNLGNLVSRLLNMVGRNFADGLPAATVEEEPERELLAAWQQTRPLVEDAFGQFQFHLGLEKTMAFVSSLNRYAEVRAPWKLAKSTEPADRERLATTLANMAEGLRLANALLQPVMPAISDRICELLAIEPVRLWAGQLDWSDRLTGKVFAGRAILFPRPNTESLTS
jgi:methionyl-tRNA synthetase